MKTLYLDCFAGISGDMFLGALFDLGVSPVELTERLAVLNVHNYRINAEKTVKNGLSATKATVTLLNKEISNRHLSNILKVIDESGLPSSIRQKTAAVFRSLAEAEAIIHNVSPEQIHFHEVGAIDAIVDIAGTIIALEILGVEQLACSPLPLGSGFVQCAHGTLPLPAPAVLELLKGIPTQTCSIKGETVTPTGAALVRTLSDSFGPMPSMYVQSIGYGAGQADREIPNLLRVVLGESAPAGDAPRVPCSLLEDCLFVAEANIDDMNPEFYGYIMPLLLAGGAVDVFITPVIMKKGRPANIITCLAAENKLEKVVNILISETTTLGVRTYPCRRYKLSRETVTVETDYGPVRVKLGLHPLTQRIINIAPEWDDCKALAEKTHLPVKLIYDFAKTETYKTIAVKD